jgi:GT2 family glycosyltransferase
VQRVLILTPVKNARQYLDGYFKRLNALTYDRTLLSLAMLESDSTDGTYDRLQELSAAAHEQFRSVKLFKRDYNFSMPPSLPRWESGLQLARRAILARSRNQLLFRALDDEDWVLWLDVDVVQFPSDLIERLLSYDLDILHPDCVREPGGKSFDLNAWKDDGRLHMHDLRGTGQPVRIDSVGGTALLVRADLHRDGLVFPCFRYGLESPAIRSEHPVWGKGEIETEGLAAMARDMGVQCWGLPDLELVHA